MAYYFALVLTGVACTLGFQSPAIVTLTFLVVPACLGLRLWMGDTACWAAAQAMASGVCLQVGYVACGYAFMAFEDRISAGPKGNAG